MANPVCILNPECLQKPRAPVKGLPTANLRELPLADPPFALPSGRLGLRSATGRLPTGEAWAQGAQPQERTLGQSSENEISAEPGPRGNGGKIKRDRSRRRG